MRINTNMAALRAVYQSNSTDSKVSNSVAKLSSGNKLADIRENPVGKSLSTKMRTQIRNLGRASDNTANGISVIETAEGALAEIHSMLQRMNELAVQGASDTYTDEDRKNIQAEINQLRDEIDRVSESTDFNTKTLLDGTLSKVSYTNSNYTVIRDVSPTAKEGQYNAFFINTAAKASFSTGTAPATLPAGRMVINGAAIDVADGDTLTSFYNKLVDAGIKADFDVAYKGSLTAGASFDLTNKEYGADEKLEINVSDDLAKALGMNDTEVSVAGKDGSIDFTKSFGFTDKASAEVHGRTVTIKDADGFEVTLVANENLKDGSNAYLFTGIADAGGMIVQTGANEEQDIRINIPKINTETLGIDKINIRTSLGAGKAITAVNDAISRISEIRSELGAFQNRMEHSIKTVDVTEENMTSALSRIEDVDMAEEMTRYTTYNVMNQAATSMLAQANQLSERVLQLLQ